MFLCVELIHPSKQTKCVHHHECNLIFLWISPPIRNFELKAPYVKINSNFQWNSFLHNEEQRLISNRKGQIICKNREQPFPKKCTSTD